MIFEGSSSFERTSGTLGIHLTSHGNTTKSAITPTLATTSNHGNSSLETVSQAIKKEVASEKVKEVTFNFVRFALAQALMCKVEWKPPHQKYIGKRDVVWCMAKLGVLAYQKKMLED